MFNKLKYWLIDKMGLVSKKHINSRHCALCDESMFQQEIGEYVVVCMNCCDDNPCSICPNKYKGDPR